MMHDISFYDTGRNWNGYYSRKRNDGWMFCAMFGGAAIFVTGFIMMMAGLFDPTAPLGLVFAGVPMQIIAAANALMFPTHRNFGLNATGTKVMDAIYSLPKDTRKQYEISRKEVTSLSEQEANRLVRVINEYRGSNRATSGLLALTRDLNDVNKTVREIEGR